MRSTVCFNGVGSEYYTCRQWFTEELQSITYVLQCVTYMLIASFIQTDIYANSVFHTDIVVDIVAPVIS